MSVILDERRRGAYLDSVQLMRIARVIRALPGIEDAGLMIGTPANKEILAEARLLSTEGVAAESGDLVIAVRAQDAAAAMAAMAEARRLIDAPRSGPGSAGSSQHRPRSLRTARSMSPDASLTLISVPGDFAAAEARTALRLDLDVMIFSDNVTIADEVALKRAAAERGRLVMGPDCGTAIVGGVPLGFANVVAPGDVGIVGASGTGIQEVACLLDRMGRGISHAIGTGGRDLKAEVGGATMLAAIDLLDGDPATTHIVLISKPPAVPVLERIVSRVGQSRKRFTLCMIGGSDISLPGNARAVPTHHAAAEDVAGVRLAPVASSAPLAPRRAPFIRGLFAGGTLCAEAQVVLTAARGFGARASAEVVSNVPIPGAGRINGAVADASAHALVDLGDDAFTRGRPHPMIEPAARDAALAEALADPRAGAILLDCVLGTGGHEDPGGHLATRLAGRSRGGPCIVASVTGTDRDPQSRSRQVAALESVGVLIAPSNATAAELAWRIVSSED